MHYILGQKTPNIQFSQHFSLRTKVFRQFTLVDVTIKTYVPWGQTHFEIRQLRKFSPYKSHMFSNVYSMTYIYLNKNLDDCRHLSTPCNVYKDLTLNPQLLDYQLTRVSCKIYNCRHEICTTHGKSYNLVLLS